MSSKEDAEFTELTAKLLMVTKGFCDYGENKGLLTPDGLRFAITKRKEVVKQLADAGASQNEIAELVGVSQKTVSRDLGQSKGLKSQSKGLKGSDKVVAINPKKLKDSPAQITPEASAKLSASITDRVVQLTGLTDDLNEALPYLNDLSELDPEDIDALELALTKVNKAFAEAKKKLRHSKVSVIKGGKDD